MEQYILENLDQALEQDHIKVYVQPVVRTLTRQYCGMEALARWDDPEHGLLLPGKFISVLEDHRRIHELDIYVLNKVCKTLKSMNRRLDVPVSVNLSRLDYELCDIFEIAESAVRANKVPRSSLCIEITESVIANNEQLMHRYIDRFREAGYSVWMDDFGSGYSSLNVLKDFMFDELKIDMRFLSDISSRSRTILASIINMAKEIGIQTLAEGVETEEQFEFLRNIGCEKVQGYLFGKPMPFEDCLRHVEQGGGTWESPRLRWYYDNIGRLNVLSARPFHSDNESNMPITGLELNSISIAILELKGNMAEMLFANQAFESTASAIDWPLIWDHHRESEGIPLNRISQRIQKLLEDTRSEGEGKSLFVYDNDYYELRARTLARQGDACSILMSVTNLSEISAMANQKQLDEGLRSLYSVYEQVALINLKDLTVVSLYLDRTSSHKLPTGNLLARIEENAEQRIYPDDRERFRQFMDPDTLEERAAREGGISIHLRALSFHGSYSWKCYQLVRIRQDAYYFLIRAAEKEVRELQAKYHAVQAKDGTLTPELLWDNVVNHADLKFFWKDTKRRFVGASRSFLDHYHFRSLDEILGKTDEDMGWHIHNDPYRDEELKVLNEGIISHKVEGNCLVQGEDQEIVATKIPLYSQDGKIVGLIGSFYQSDSHLAAKDAVRQARTDDLTGLLNSRGLYEDMYAYIDEYELRGRDFALIEVSIDDFEDFNTRFGYDFGDSVIREIGRKLLKCCSNKAVVARISGFYYKVLRQYETQDELDELIARIRQIAAEPCRVNGASISVYLSVGMALYSETRNRESMEMQAEMRRMTDDVENITQHQLMENTGHIFHVFDEFPLAYAVYKIINEPGGGDAIFLYVNKCFVDMTRLTHKELIGRRVSNFFAQDADNWLQMAEEAGLNGKSSKGEFHDTYMDCDYEITAYPVIGPGFCAFTFNRK